MAVACSSPAPDNPSTPKGEAVWAPDVYWADDYDGPIGIPVGESKSGEPRMTLGGVQLYCSGINCYNLLVQTWETSNMNAEHIKETIEHFETEKVPIVRFSCSPFHNYQFTYFVDQPEWYFGLIETIAEECDKRHILLIPSFFWNVRTFNEYCGEKLTAWGDTSSKTHALMRDYATKVINVLKGHKCIAAWEFGNEFSLAADTGIAGYEQMPATCVNVALKAFAELCAANDPEGRLITSGNSIMRDAQYHMFHNQSWETDTFDQYVEMTELMTPEPMKGISEHIYEDGRSFAGLGKVNRRTQLKKAKECAARLGKVYYVGEYTGLGVADDDEALTESFYKDFYDERIQISLAWNCSLTGQKFDDFKFDSTRGDKTFQMMRRYNKLYSRLPQD